jgi:hypothetical protein
LLAYFLDKLKNTPDGDGNLLDHSVVLYGSPMGDSNVHNHKRVPMLLGGPWQRRIQRQSAFEDRGWNSYREHVSDAVAQAWRGLPSIGDSTGELSI